MHKYHPVTWLAYFCACIRSSLDYACPVFHSSLPNYLHTDPKRVQKRALDIFPGKAYAEALTNAGIVPIKDHHNAITKKLFQSISENQDNKIYHLVPNANNNSKYNLRKNRKYSLPLVRYFRTLLSCIVIPKHYMISVNYRYFIDI